MQKRLKSRPKLVGQELFDIEPREGAAYYGTVKRIFPYFFGLVFGLAGARPILAQSQLGVLCFSASGKISLRDKCLSSETTAALSHLAKKGPTGDTGAAGSAGAVGRAVSFTNQGVNLVEQSGLTIQEACPANKVPSGGGCSSESATVIIARSYPSSGGVNGWTCQFKPRVGANATSLLTTFVVCIDP